MSDKKLVLVNPVKPGAVASWMRFTPLITAPLGLCVIAALTTDDWEVVLCDENFDTFKYQQADLVGITSLTLTANRAYEIAGMYRERGVPVVIGGVHASMMPEEALEYADTVVIGEAESVWPKLIEDFEAGRMQQAYKGEWLELDGMVRPRRDLLSPKYHWGTIETARGCQEDCEFCSVPAINGRHHRQRPIEEVLDEMESIPQRWLYFLDNNLVHRGKRNEERAIELFDGMVRRGIKKYWFGQTCINFADNEDVVEAAARAGCFVVEIGLEAEDVEALAETGKKANLKLGVDAYRDALKRIHRHGIAISGTFILGMESDTREKLRDRTDYQVASNVDLTIAFPLTPLPGTRLMQKMKEEDRLLYTNFPSDWDYYDFMHVTYRPALMTPEELTKAWMEGMRRVNNTINISRRIVRSFRDAGERRFFLAAFTFMSNLVMIGIGIVYMLARGMPLKEMFKPPKPRLMWQFKH